MAKVLKVFSQRRFTGPAKLARRNSVQEGSAHEACQQSTLAVTKQRAKSVDHLNLCHQSEEEKDEKWKANLQVIFVRPSGMTEFECRVETVKNAVMAEMDEESARDMRNYHLAKRRKGICKMLLKSRDRKASETLGILGFGCM